MKKIKLLIATLLMVFVVNSTANSQVLISLLLGDKLNSPNLEFGIDGGVNWLNMSNTPNAKPLFDWNLGFYFDFKMKHNLFIHTGVLVKSKMGTAGLTPYQLSDTGVYEQFVNGGTVDRKINYFNVPVMLRYRFVDYLHIEAGIQLGLRYTGYDVFTNKIYEDEDLVFKNDVKDNFTRLDAGAEAGLGYKLKKGEGMTIGVRYYYGFVDVNKIESGTQANSALYVCASIPIGKGKAQKKEKEKEAKEKQ